MTHLSLPRRRRPSDILPRLLLAGVVALVSFLVLMAPAIAAGPTAPKQPTALTRQAAQWKSQGDHAMDELRYDDALAAYQKAYELTSDPALLYNQARTFQARGDFVSAFDLLARFQASAPPSLLARVPDLKGLVEDVRGKITTLTLYCNAEGAEVVLRDKVVGTTPLSAPIRTTAGKASLVVHADKYQEYRTSIDLPGGESMTFDVPMTLKDTRGVLVVTSAAAGAEVTVDGILRGNVPLELVTPAGPHAIHLERSGYEPAESAAVLDPGMRKEIDVPMVKKTSVFARWWFWTAVGVVVAGGVTTAILATTERSPSHGSINPGVLSAPAALIRF